MSARPEQRCLSVFLCARLAPAATANSPPVAGSNSPARAWRDRGILCGGGARRNAGHRFLQAPALAFKLQQIPVVHEAVEERNDDHRVAEQAGLVLEGPV